MENRIEKENRRLEKIFFGFWVMGSVRKAGFAEGKWEKNYIAM